MSTCTATPCKRLLGTCVCVCVTSMYTSSFRFLRLPQLFAFADLSFVVSVCRPIFNEWREIRFYAAFESTTAPYSPSWPLAEFSKARYQPNKKEILHIQIEPHQTKLPCSPSILHSLYRLSLRFTLLRGNKFARKFPRCCRVQPEFYSYFSGLKGGMRVVTKQRNAAAAQQIKQTPIKWTMR